MSIWLVGLGGALGAWLRYVISGWINKKTKASFPWGTFIVNTSGSFFLGMVLALASDTTTLLIGTGMLGAFTTFSTFMHENLHYLTHRRFFILFLYLFLSMIAGLCMAGAGYFLLLFMLD